MHIMLRKSGLALALAAVGALSAMGQGFGLPLADNAKIVPRGQTSVGAAAVLGDTYGMIAARGTYSVADPLKVFMDAGATDVDGGDMGPSMQIGAIYCLPLNETFDLGVRAAGYMYAEDEMNLAGANAMLIGSAEVYYVGFFLYAGIGADWRVTHKDRPIGGASEDDEFDISAVVGTSFCPLDKLSLFIELAHVDEPFISGGFRYHF